MDELDNIEHQNTLDKELEKEKNFFVDTAFGKIVNNSLNIAISYAFPNIIDDQIINIKDAIIEGGFKAGLEELKNTGINYKESIEGLITGNFKTVEQMRTIIKDGGLLDIVSFCIDKGLKYLEDKNIVGKDTINIIKSGKNILINQLSTTIEKKYSDQLIHVEKLAKSCDNWKTAYDNKDLDNMNKYYKQINLYRKKVVPVEEIIKRADTIKNIQAIVNSSNSLNLSKEELELANKI